MAQHFLKRGVDVSWLAELIDDGLRGFFRFSFAQQKDDFARFVWREFDSRLDARRTDRVPRRRVRQDQCACSAAGVSSELLRPRNSLRSHVALEKGLARRRERHAIGELVVERIRAKIVAVGASISVMMYGADEGRATPSTSSL